MFEVSEIRLAIAAMLALGAVSSSSATENTLDAAFAGAADSFQGLRMDSSLGSQRMMLAAAEGTGGSDSSGVPTLEKPKSTTKDAGEAAISTDWGNASGGSLFGADSPMGATQRASTAGYELSGGVASGHAPAQGAILTSPSRGRPIFTFDNGIFVYPAVTLGFGRNDNLTGTQTNKIGTNFTLLKPELLAEMKHAGDRYTMSYSGNYARYNSSSPDDYDHHEVWAAADNYFTSRIRLGWGVGYIDRTDARGSTNSGATPVPSRWHSPVFRALGIYGAQGAIGRAELETSVMQKRYTNNRTTTEAMDVDTTMVAGRFYYRFMPKTSALVELKNTRANYILGTSTQDGDARTVHLGVTWDATAKTTGTIKMGRTSKNFDNNATFKDGSLATWEASVRWSPLTYSTVDFLAAKTTDESTGVGSFLVNNTNSATWNHKWASYISSRLTAGLTKTEYMNSPTGRKDDTKSYGIGMFHELGYNFRLGVDWTHTDKTSSDPVNDFKRNVTMLSLEGVL